MLKNASSLAIVGLDTAENGPSKVRQVTNRIDAIIGPRGRGGARAGGLVARFPRMQSEVLWPKGQGYLLGTRGGSERRLEIVSRHALASAAI